MTSVVHFYVSTPMASIMFMEFFLQTIFPVEMDPNQAYLLQ